MVKDELCLLVKTAKGRAGMRLSEINLDRDNNIGTGIFTTADGLILTAAHVSKVCEGESIYIVDEERLSLLHEVKSKIWYIWWALL